MSIRGEEGRIVMEQHATAARNAFDKIDKDGNGYLIIDELQGLADVLGLPLVTPVELDDAVEALDGDGGGVLDRDEWVRWWVRRCQDDLEREEQREKRQHEVAVRNPFNRTTGEDDGADTETFPRDKRIVENHNKDRDVCGEDDAGVSCAEFAEHSVHELTEITRKGRRRTGTDIHTAAWKGDLALVKDFLEHDPTLANAVDVSEFGTGYRPMHYAAYGGFLDVCEALDSAGARASSAGDNGVTALFLAAQAGKADVVRFLLDLRADPTICEAESGLCAADVAQDYPEILGQMLRKGEFQVPSAPDVPPTVTRVGESSFQVTFCPILAANGQLPTTRYKVKVEHHTDVKLPATSSSSSTTTTRNGSSSSSKSSSKIRRASKVSLDGKLPSKSKADSIIATPESVSPRLQGNGDNHPDIGDTSRQLAELVLVPAGGRKPSSEREGEQKTIVTVRNLQPGTCYRVQIAGVNVMGFGPYGPASAPVRTLEHGMEQVNSNRREDPESRRTRRSGETSLMSSSRGRSRQAMAREKRRIIAEEVTKLQDIQRREAEERQSRRAEKMTGIRRFVAHPPAAPLATTAGGRGRGRASRRNRTDGDNSDYDGRRLKIQSLPLLHQNGSQRLVPQNKPSGNTNSNSSAHDDDDDDADDLSESTDDGSCTNTTNNFNNKDDASDDKNRSLFSTTFPPGAKPAPGQGVPGRATCRPGLTRPNSGPTRAAKHGPDVVARRRIVSAPSKAARSKSGQATDPGATDNKRCCTGRRVPGRVSAGDLRQGRNTDRAGRKRTIEKKSGRDGSSSVVVGGIRRGGRSVSENWSPKVGRESDVEVSSCGDVTISSAEEGDGMGYAG